MNPLSAGCAAYSGYSLSSLVTKTDAGSDCLAEINAAIATAAGTAHKNVVIPRGAMLITGALNPLGDVHLIGAGPRKSVIAYRNSWAPPSAVPMIQTTDSASAAPYIGFFSLYIRTSPLISDWMYYLRWRSGKNSMSVMMEYQAQFKCDCSGATSGSCPASNPENHNQPRKSLWWSGNGGGRHYGNHFDLINNLDRHVNSRTFFFDGTSQPLSLYGFNAEGAKQYQCGQPNSNNEALGASNIRLYGAKHEGEVSPLLVTASSNIGLYSMGALAGPPDETSGAFVRVVGASSNILVANMTVRNMTQAANANTMVTETIAPAPTPGNAGSAVPWPNAVSVFKRGTLNHAPFTDTGTPPPAAPTLRSAEIIAANRLDMCRNIFDGTAMSPNSGTSGGQSW